jgi:hypothetical protein
MKQSVAASSGYNWRLVIAYDGTHFSGSFFFFFFFLLSFFFPSHKIQIASFFYEGSFEMLATLHILCI